MKSLTHILTIILLFYSHTTFAQPGWLWGTSGGAGDPALSAVDKDGNVYAEVPSGTYGTITTFQPGVAKIDPSGNFLWVIECSSGGPIGLGTDNWRNLYVLGVYSGTITLGSFTLTAGGATIGVSQLYLAKISPSGTVIWAKNVLYGGFTFATAFAYKHLAVDGAGNSVISGQFTPATASVGATSLANTDATGMTKEVFICKFDPSGNPVWAKSFSGNKNDYAFSLSVTKSGNFYISGSYTSDTLNILGTKLAGTPKPYDSTKLFFHDLKGNYLAKFSATGNLIWAHPINYNERLVSTTVDDNENLYVTGYIDSTVVLGTDTFQTGGKSSVFFARYDSAGNYKWGVSSPTTDDQGYDISLDACGNLWVCGSFRQDMVFSGHTLIYPPGLFEPSFMVEYDTAGHYEAGVTINVGGDDALSIGVDNSGNFYIVGDYWGDTVVFANDTLKGTWASENFFIAKYKYQTNLCAAEIALPVKNIANSNVPDVSLYPNPANQTFKVISTKEFESDSKLELYDLIGKLVGTYQLCGNNVPIAVEGLRPGIYQCRIILQDRGVLIKKILIEK